MMNGDGNDYGMSIGDVLLFDNIYSCEGGSQLAYMKDNDKYVIMSLLLWFLYGENIAIMILR